MQTSAPNANWVSVASSADGNRLAVINYIPPDPLLAPGSPIYVSTNSGATWAPPASVIGANDWGLVACSADGYQLLITTGYGPFCLSTNGGLDWLLTGPFSTWNLYPSCVGLSASADGNKLAAVFDGFGVRKGVS